MQNPTSLIGLISFTQKSECIGQIDYVLSEEHWNKGIMTESAKSLIDWIFNNISSINEIRSCGLVENSASLRVMQKTGMRCRKNDYRKIAKFGEQPKEVSCYFIKKEQPNT
ncbi:GCN5-related N-acetyltransferase domain protein [Desulfosarcina variabilis str. Montpellier]|uniref:GNAT family N-acetyltransferase n=1 Tax=Desulfosarcina variabilis TaxID=2300 RepID=UPI003AFA1F96